jgi:predicted methyltransferase
MTTRPVLPFVLLAALLAPACAAESRSQEAHQHPPAAEERPGETRGPHDATARHPFDDVEKWVRVFDDPARDAWQKPEEVVAALRLKPGMIVADIGAGTGYFIGHLARAVAPDGFVLAIDTEPEMVRHMGGRAQQEKLANAVPVLARPDDPFLPRRRLGLVLIVNTYHHIDDRLNYFDRLKGALAPGGRVAVIDFHKKPLPVGPPPAHKLERGFVLDEMRQAGFRLVEEETFLPYQYFLVFAPGGAGAHDR